jgi:hypothetical protein
MVFLNSLSVNGPNAENVATPVLRSCKITGKLTDDD